MALFSRLNPEQIRAAIRLRPFTPNLQFSSLIPGVDNSRHDVHLSPAFGRFASAYVCQLFVKHSAAGQFLQQNPGPPTPRERSEFKRLIQEVLLAALSQAKAAGNADIDLLANIALFKYLGGEVQRQYGRILGEAREKLKLYEGPRHERNLKAFQLKDLFSEFQTSKRIILRRVSSEILLLANEVQADVVRKTRESLFGPDTGQWFAYFSNPLVFTDSGRDDYIHLSKYVMLGNFHKDPDRYERVEAWLRWMLRWLESGTPEVRELEAGEAEVTRLKGIADTVRGQTAGGDRVRGLGRLFGGGGGTAPAESAAQLERLDQELALAEGQRRLAAENYDAHLADLLSAVENTEELFGVAATEQALAQARTQNPSAPQIAALTAKLEAQRALIEAFASSAEQNDLLGPVAAAYETASIYQDYCPPINPQQLKHGLLDAAERKKVAALIEHYKLVHASEARLEEAAARVRSCQPREFRVLLVRFIHDFVRHYRDARLLAAFQGLLERVNLTFDERTRELSRVNSTLYEFLLPEERKPRDERVTGHVILKADVRDSTRMTAELFERGLNPASHFSLNFFEPLSKLLPRYAAEKVFIEGDAVILSIFEKEGTELGGCPVARACGLAREIMEVVALYNSRAEHGSLPRLEIGIGICWQNSAPMYLLDGDNRIMISSAINLADRLSGCSKLARKALAGSQSPFNVFVFQAISEEAAGGAAEEFLVRFNTGICLSQEAFEKLQSEISLQPLDLEMALPWKTGCVRLYVGSFPLSRDLFQRLVIREAAVPFMDLRTMTVCEETGRHYYEVCTDRAVYDATTEQAAIRASTP